MSKWITDRLPTKADTSKEGRWLVWTCYEGQVKQWSYDGITLGQPWQPIVPPEPYVKPKRWVAENNGIGSYWRVRDTSNGELANIAVLREDVVRKLETFLNEVMP